MGNATNSNQKANGSATNTGQPAWSQPGTDAYKDMNQNLQTGPMAVANQTLAQGGQGQTTQNVVGNIMNGGAYNPGQIGEQNFQNVYNQAGQPGAAQQYLSGYAQGDYLNGSPYLDSIISKGAQDIGTQTGQMFAAGGRYGSGAHQGTVSDSVANYANNLRYQDFNQQQQNQMNAANAISNEQQGRLGLQSGAAGGIAGVQGQNIGNQMNANQQHINNQFGAAGLENQGFQNMLGMIGQLGNIQNNKVFDANQQMNVGNQIDQRTQQGLQDLINQWTQTDMEPWARLGGLMSAGTTTAGNWGTQTQTTNQPANWAGMLGGLASLAKALPFSDRRLKTDIKRVGMADNGLPIYSYRYVWGGPVQIGFMADEVELVNPQAVGQRDGFKTVNYDMAVN